MGSGTNSRWNRITESVVMFAMLAASGAILLHFMARALDLGAAEVSPTNTPAAFVPTEPVSLDGVLTIGRDSAEVVLIEYSDFECPFCRRFAMETLPAFIESHVATGKASYAFRHLPLRIHAHAMGAAKAAYCAGEQGRFRQMHRLLFEEPGRLDEVSILNRSATVGLDRNRYNRCMSESAERAVAADMASAQMLRVTGTPTLFLGRRQDDGTVLLLRRLKGAVSADVLSEAANSVAAR